MNRLANDNYERPKQTLQEKMSEIEIAEKLKNYEKVDNIMNVDIGTHVRYFKNDNGEMKFRLGGNLINKDKEGRYVVLSNGKSSWSASTANCIFYREYTLEDLRAKYSREINDLKKENNALKLDLGELKQKYTTIKRELNRVKRSHS
jgi:hypothetical protein